MNYFNTEEPYLLFQKAVRNDIFVDKSMLIDAVASKIGTNSGICASRAPRQIWQIHECADARRILYKRRGERCLI